MASFITLAIILAFDVDAFDQRTIFDPSISNPSVDDFQSMGDMIHTCASKEYARSACMATLGGALAKSYGRFRQRSSGPLWQKVVTSQDTSAQRAVKLAEGQRTLETRQAHFQACDGDTVAKANNLQAHTQAVEDANRNFDAADAEVTTANQEVTQAGSRVTQAQNNFEAARGQSCYFRPSCFSERLAAVQSAQDELQSANNNLQSATAERDQLQEVYTREQAAQREAAAQLEQAQRESTAAEASAADASAAVDTQTALVEGAAKSATAAAGEAATAETYWASADFACIALTAGSCGAALTTIAVVGSAASELYTLKSSVDTVYNALTDAEASLERVEDAFKDTVAFGNAFPPVATQDTWPDIIVLLHQQHHRTHHMSTLLKTSIDDVRHADMDYDDSTWCSWGPGWGCGTRVPDGALSELNSASSSLDTYTESLNDLSDCLSASVNFNHSCSVSMLQSINAQKSSSLREVCIHLKNAACQWGDGRLSSSYCSQDCGSAPASLVEQVQEPVSLVGVHETDPCSSVVRSLEQVQQLAESISISSGAFILVFLIFRMQHAMSMDTVDTVQRVEKRGLIMELCSAVYPVLLAAVSGYSWMVCVSTSDGREYAAIADNSDLCRHILFHNSVPEWMPSEWMPSGQNLSLVLFVLFILVGLVPSCCATKTAPAESGYDSLLG